MCLKMWVSIPTVVLVIVLAVQNVAGATAPVIEQTSSAPAVDQGRNKDDNSTISLEYKPIKPSYLSSGSNVAQIVPPGEPWPASPAGYANFSQLGAAPTKNVVDENVPLLQSAPTSPDMINLDMSNPNTNFAEALEKILTPELSNVSIQKEPQTISSTINITPPPNANMDFVKELQTAARIAVGKLVPFAGTSLKISITKASSGAIVNVKAYLNITIPAAVKKTTPTLPPSKVPEIDLTKGLSDLSQSLQSILSKELQQAGYNPDAESEQDFSLSFSVLPPEGADQEFVRLYVLGPLQTVLKNLAPRAALTSVSVNTQESNKKILRQIVKLNVQVKPPSVPKVSQKVIDVPEVNLNVPGINLENTVIATLQNQMKNIVTLDPTQPKTLSIPFKISPPAGATQQEIQEQYILPISQVLSKLDPTGKILSISEKTLPNGDLILIVYMNIPANATTNPAVPPETSTSTPETSTSSVQAISQVPSIKNRNSFEEDEESETFSNIDLANATLTPTVDLSQKEGSLEAIQNILNDELSPTSNPSEDNQPKVLAIPFKMKPTPGTTIQQVEENVVEPLARVLSTLEPTGKFVNAHSKSLPNGEVESVIYFLIPSVDNSKTYKDLSKTMQNPSTTTGQPSTEESAFSATAQSTTASITEAPTSSSTTNPEVPPEQNEIRTAPINLSHPNFDALKKGIEQRLNDIIKKNPTQSEEPQIVSFPFLVPKEQGKNIPVIAQAIATLLKGLVPSGKALPTISPDIQPNGDVEFVINYEIPAPSKTNEEVVPPSVEKKARKKNFITNEIKAEEQVSTEPTSESKITPITETSESPISPKNALLTAPIDFKHPDFQTIKNDLLRNIDEVASKTNEKHEVIGIPFIMSNNPSYFTKLSLEHVLKLLLPGELLPESETKKLPNGDVEYIVYYKKPTKEKKPSETTVKPITETSKSPITPENAVVTKHIDVKNLDMDDVQKKIKKIIDDVKKGKYRDVKEIDIPFVLSKKLESPFIEIALKNLLNVMLPSGQVSSKPTYKDLPNGDVEMVFKYEPSENEEPEIKNKNQVSTESTATESSLSEIISKQTEPSVSRIKPQSRSALTTVKPEVNIPITETSESTISPENAVVTKHIDVKNLDMDHVQKKIKKIIDDVKKGKYRDVKEIDIPFVLSKKLKSPFIEIALKNLLNVMLPSGQVSSKPTYKDLPNGDVEMVFKYEPSKNEEPEIKNKNQVSTESTVTESSLSEIISKQTEPSISNRNQESRTVLSTVRPEVSAVPVTESQNENQNVQILKPIDLKQFDFKTIQDGVEQRIKEASKTSNGQSQTLGLAFDFPSNVPYIGQIGLQKVLQTILPGKISENPEKKALSNGGTQLIFYYKTPDTEEKKQEETIEPVEAVEDVNLDETSATVSGEVGKALTKAISTISSRPEDLNRPADLKFNIYAPLDNTPLENQNLVNDVSKELQKIEPNAKIISAKVNSHPSTTEPDGEVEIIIPSIASSKTSQNLKNVVEIPYIDINVPELKLVDTIKGLLQRGLKSTGQVNPEGSQLFDLNFRLNPFDTKGSVLEILKALKAVDPTGEVVSYKIYSRPDGLDYLNVSYLIPNLEDSILYKVLRPKQPEIVYESVVNIDTRNPLNGLLEKVISEVGAAEEEVKGAKLEQLVDLPLDFKFTNSKGLSDSAVSRVISQTLPYIQGYISQVLPEGKILSTNTVELPDSDDVILKIIVRAPYEPDNTIVIEEQRPRKPVTTPKPKSKGIFGFFG